MSTTEENPIPRLRLAEQDMPAQRTPEWDEMRKQMLTSTAISVIAQEKPLYQNENSVYMQKTGRAPPFKGNFNTRWGNTLEDQACQLYEQKTGRKVEHFGLMRHPKEPWIGGSPDGVTTDGRLVEIKCPVSRPILPEVPVHYYGQVQCLMEVLDLQLCDFVQYKPGKSSADYTLQITTIRRNPAWWAEKLPVFRKFWDRVLRYHTERAARLKELQKLAGPVIGIHVLRWYHHQRKRTACPQLQERQDAVLRRWNLLRRQEWMLTRPDRLATRCRRMLREERRTDPDRLWDGKRAPTRPPRIHPLDDDAFMESRPEDGPQRLSAKGRWLGMAYPPCGNGAASSFHVNFAS